MFVDRVCQEFCWNHWVKDNTWQHMAILFYTVLIFSFFLFQSLWRDAEAEVVQSCPAWLPLVMCHSFTKDISIDSQNGSTIPIPQKPPILISIGRSPPRAAVLHTSWCCNCKAITVPTIRLPYNLTIITIMPIYPDNSRYIRIYPVVQERIFPYLGYSNGNNLWCTSQNWQADLR